MSVSPEGNQGTSSPSLLGQEHDPHEITQTSKSKILSISNPQVKFDAGSPRCCPTPRCKNWAMSEFAVGCRVRCVDATPLPINVPGSVLTDSSCPGGLLEEGAVYYVEWVGTNSTGRTSLQLSGFPILHLGRCIQWDSLRFRKVYPHGKKDQAAKNKEGRVAAITS